MQLVDVYCRVEQAQAVISLWLEAGTSSDEEMKLVGALSSLLDEVPESIRDYINSKTVEETK
ncbi:MULTISPECIES: hypothetical protein [unclassified Serratia (in: enterobacteria)]|uniref:hypothetical protein n=1 Tax=unclassified Serratia (in: enterobacteria) TaxID=2647522 RepID=UPI0030763183